MLRSSTTNSNDIKLSAVIFGKIIPFIIIMYVIACMSDRIIMSFIYKADSGNFVVWNKLLNGKINADIIIIGSSRAQFHFDSNAIAKLTNNTVYNIGVSAAHLEMQTPTTLLYYKHNKPPKVLIISLDINSMEQAPVVFEPFQYLPYLSEDILFNKLALLDDDFIKYKYIPLYGVALFKKELFSEAFSKNARRIRQFRDKNNGYVERDLNWTNDFEEFKRSNINGIRYKVEDKYLRELELIIQLAKKHNTKVILVYSPEYLDGQLLTINRNDIFDIFKKTAIKYNVSFWDYSNLPINGNKYYFYNSQHLNKRGVAVFVNEFALKLNDFIHLKNIQGSVP